MVCPNCKTINDDNGGRCSTCQSDLGLATQIAVPQTGKEMGSEAEEATVIYQSESGAFGASSPDDGRTIPMGPHDDRTLPMGPNEGAGPTFTSLVDPSMPVLSLQPGNTLGGRYKILRRLGEGGMGAVYQAQDLEVDRLVALKVIRPELADHPAIMQRFKSELVLARQITHRNVARVYDLGVADNVKFISMEFIEGRELESVLKEAGKLEPKHAAEIMLQVCRGLEAAHAEGVVHRDLKPQNIMIDNQGRAAVMDFGIAHSIGGPAATLSLPGGGVGDTEGRLTVAGSLLGTPWYMSPEQAKAEATDARSDIFTVGIIFYELLTGDNPFLAKSGKETLRKRIEETARPPIVLNPEIPKPLNQIVVKCLERDPANRYASAAGVVHDLEIWLGIRSTLRATQMRRMKWIAASLGVLLLAASGFLGWNLTRPQTNKPHEAVKVLISDFTNRTGSPAFDGTLEPMVQVALERAPFITTFNRGAAQKTASELQPGQTRMDDALAKLVALREGLGVIVSGGIEKHGNGFRISMRATDPTKASELVSQAVDISATRELPQAVEQLGGRIRRALGDVTKTPQSLAEETFTAGSLDAAQQYAQAQDLQWAGKWDEAIAAYQKAVQYDPNMSRAYAGLAAVLANLGRPQEAAKYYGLALAHVDRMSDREKLRTRGGYYLLTRNYQLATEQFRALVSQYPADTAGISNLALAYFYARNMSAALELGQKAVDIYPKNLLYRDNVALFAMYAGDFDRAIKENQAILQINPAFAKGWQGLAMSYLAKRDETDAEAAYQKLSELGAAGASEAALGRADLEVYRGSLPRAADLLETAIREDLANSKKSEAALKRVLLAEVDFSLRRTAKGLDEARQALQASDDLSVLYPVGHLYAEGGQSKEALALAGTLGQRFEPEPRALGKLIEGEVALNAHKVQDAVALFQDAQKLADSWLGRFDMGRAYLAAKIYPDADNEFDVCVKRRGEASAVFLDDEPTLHYLPPVYYYAGLARKGLNSPGATESFNAFFAMKHAADHDPMVEDAKRHGN